MAEINNSNRIVAICGPTAVGKTDISIRIATDFNMEIVSCDSMQIYKYMDIGSAKPSPKEMEEIPHHMIGVVDPLDCRIDSDYFFSVVNYSQMARSAIDDIISRGKTPLIVGGTGLYLDSIIYDIDFAAAPDESSKANRDELYKIAEESGPEALHKLLMELDPDSAYRIHPNNIKRVVRAIEASRSGENVQAFRRSFDYRKEYEPILIGLTRNREELYDRINRRVDALMEEGLLEEVKNLVSMGLTGNDYPMKGIGYKEIIDYLDDKVSLDEAITMVKTNSRHYAKRQFTWFKRYEDMKWFDLTGVGEINQTKGYEEIVGEIEEWLKIRL